MNDPIPADPHNNADVTEDTRDEHPAGEIQLPRRVRSEARILALAGIAYGVTTLGALNVACASMLSISVTR